MIGRDFRGTGYCLLNGKFWEYCLLVGRFWEVPAFDWWISESTAYRLVDFWEGNV